MESEEDGAPSTGTTTQSAGETPATPVTDARRVVLRQHTLRDRIVEHLRATQTDSISGIARLLAATGHAPVHRLTVAGYLQAMAEAGILRELDRPPSKLYQLQNPESHWSLHQRVHRILQESPISDADRCRLALAVLQRLLGRPIFQAELHHAGFHDVPGGIERTVVGDAVRRGYRDLFTRRASPRIDVPARDPLLALPETDPLLTNPAVEETIRKVLVRATAAEHLVAERPAGPQQAQLDLGGAP
ncbi:MAG: hypothetical protein ABR562_03270 [Thermoplasmatota archaeon]|nr:hypothetical protein [Halobacteriales archaeon]